MVEVASVFVARWRHTSRHTSSSDSSPTLVTCGTFLTSSVLCSSLLVSYLRVTKWQCVHRFSGRKKHVTVQKNKNAFQWDAYRPLFTVGGFSVQGESLSRGVSVREATSPCGQTNACESITLPQTSFEGGNNQWRKQNFQERGHQSIIVLLCSHCTGMIVRNIDCSECVEAGRIVLSICLMMFWFRILHIFSVHKELGPSSSWSAEWYALNRSFYLGCNNYELDIVKVFH